LLERFAQRRRLRSASLCLRLGHGVELELGDLGRVAEGDALVGGARLKAFLADGEAIGTGLHAHLHELALLVRLHLELAGDATLELDQHLGIGDRLGLGVRHPAASGAGLRLRLGRHEAET
jgi:hypothetical protein